jgi:hypothetical protein
VKWKRSLFNFILFPAITMMLGWGLRGYIGGGPFGAMIPGAMVAICLSMLLNLPLKLAPVVAVFGVVAIGLGGEMTYGQTLGFLHNQDTMWWGTLGTTVKGSIWGLMGGIVLAMGINYDRLSGRAIIFALIILMAGMLTGFKLINQPMLVYFSDRANPRPESWGALLVGAIFLFVFLWIKLDAVSFKIVWRFAILGMIGGGLGFGLGGFWMVLGSRLSDTVIFTSWWKAMEFTFGLILGAFLGLAAWLNRKQIAYLTIYPDVKPEAAKSKILKDLLGTLIVGLLIFWAIAALLDPIVDVIPKGPRFTMPDKTDVAIMFSNYAFYGFLMILAVIFFPSSAWQIAITLTFCHTLIDLMQDVYPDIDGNSMLTTRMMLVSAMTLVVAIFTAWGRHLKNILNWMFQLLTWSTVSVAFLRLFHEVEISKLSGLAPGEIIFGRFFVHVIFIASAVIISWLSYRLAKDS